MNHPNQAHPIPDNTNISGRTADGITFTMPAGTFRNPHYRTELRGIKLFIGLPVYQKMETFFAQCLMALQAQKPCPIEVHISQGDGVARSRNQLTAEFLRSDCTHLLFIDCDLIFTVDHITRLLSHGLPVVGGFYPKKQEGPLEWVINTLPDQPKRREDGLQAVRYVGTGFMCIERSVFEQMAQAYPETRYREDYGIRGHANDFWPMGVYRKDPADEGRYLSEDWYFCQRWLDQGGEIYADCRVILKHIGTSIFPLHSQESEINIPLDRTPAASGTDTAAPLTAFAPAAVASAIS